MAFYPCHSGSPCEARGKLCPCTFRLVHVHCTTPAGIPVKFSASQCIDCKLLLQTPHANTKNVNAFTLATSCQAIHPANIDCIIPIPTELQPGKQVLHYCSTVRKVMDNNGVPHFQCSECHTMFPWHINMWQAYQLIPEGILPVQMVMNMFQYQATNRALDFYMKLDKVKIIQQWWHNKFEEFNVNNVKQCQHKDDTLALSKDTQHKHIAAKTIFRFLYLVTLRKKKARGIHALVQLQSFFRRRISMICYKFSRTINKIQHVLQQYKLRKSWNKLCEFVNESRRNARAIQMQSCIRSWQAKRQLNVLQKQRAGTTRLKNVVARLLKKHVFGALKTFFMAPKHTAAMVIQSAFCCFNNKKKAARAKEQAEKRAAKAKERKRRKKKRHRNNKKKKKQTIQHVPKVCVVKAVPTTTIPDSVIVDHIKIFNTFFETIKLKESLCANAKALMYAVCVRGIAILGKFMKKNVYTTPPFRMTNRTIFGIKKVVENSKPCGKESMLEVDGVIHTIAPCSFVLKRSQQVVHCILPTTLLVALCEKGMIPEYDLILSYYIQLILYISQTASMSTAIITKSYNHASSVLVNPRQSQFAGIEQGGYQHALPTILLEALDDICIPLSEEFTKYYDQVLGKAVLAHRYYGNAFFYMDTAYVVEEKNLVQVQAIATLTKSMVNALYMLASDFNQGSEYPKKGLGQRLRHLCQTNWDQSPKSLWDACVDLECARQSLDHPEKNKKYMKCLNKLNKRKLPDYPQNIDKAANSFAQVHTCDSKPIIRHIFSKVRDLSATLKTGSNVKCLFSCTPYHLDAILMVLHLKMTEVFEPHLMGQVPQHLVSVISALQLIFCMEAHPVTGQIQINYDANRLDSTVTEVLSGWTVDAMLLLKLSRHFMQYLLEYSKPFDKSCNVKVQILNTHCKKNIPLKEQVEGDRLDIQGTTLLYRLVQLFLHEIYINDVEDALSLLFLSSCIILQQPVNKDHVWKQLNSIFFKKQTHLGDFFEGMFCDTVCEPNEFNQRGKQFISCVSRILKLE